MKRILFLTVVACTLTSTAALQAKLPDTQKTDIVFSQIPQDFVNTHGKQIEKIFIQAWKKPLRDKTAKFTVKIAEDEIVIIRVPNHEKQTQIEAHAVTQNGVQQAIFMLYLLARQPQNGASFIEHLEPSSAVKQPNEIHIKPIYWKDPLEDSED